MTLSHPYMYLLLLFYFFHYKDYGMNYHNLQSFHTINGKKFPAIGPIKDEFHKICHNYICIINRVLFFLLGTYQVF